MQIRKSVSPVEAKIINLKNNMIPLLPARHVHIGKVFPHLMAIPLLINLVRPNAGQCFEAC